MSTVLIILWDVFLCAASVVVAALWFAALAVRGLVLGVLFLVGYAWHGPRPEDDGPEDRPLENEDLIPGDPKTCPSRAMGGC
jgi:hypothetical protein